jgi:hypothetical protein
MEVDGSWRLSKPGRKGSGLMASAGFARQCIAQNLCNLLMGAFAARSLDLFARCRARFADLRRAQFQPDPDLCGFAGDGGVLVAETPLAAE